MKNTAAKTIWIISYVQVKKVGSVGNDLAHIPYGSEFESVVDVRISLVDDM